MKQRNYLAVDLGAESGRAVIGSFDGAKLSLADVHRFANRPVRIAQHMHWNILSLFDEIGQGLRKAMSQSSPVSMGIDTWGVDFGLLDKHGELIGNPYHYRDSHTDTMMAEAFKRVPRAEIFADTGLQFLQFNTLYQLLALSLNRPTALENAATLLMIPDLLHYWLTGEKGTEFTNATTTQMLNPHTRDWARGLMDRLGIPHHFLPQIIQPGTVLGRLSTHARRNLGLPDDLPLKVITPATHDTGSAVAATPAGAGTYAYISSGTWSLMGVESPTPIINDTAARFNITNEGGIGGYRVLKNIMGLWLVQECRRAWTEAGHEFGYPQLMQMAAEARPLISIVDPDHSSFLHPDNMPAAIAAYCAQTGQPAPADRAAITRCALESLALKYRYTLDQMELLTGTRVETIHILGGGSQNELLCQLAADACGREVVAGPVEATAIGNVLAQMLAQGDVASIAEGRALVRASFPLIRYTPNTDHSAAWADAYGRFVGNMQEA